jgi:SNF2 family DNA or RNA helicase
MISKKAVKDFLAEQKLQNLTWIKKLRRAKLRELAKKYKLKFYNPSYKHQIASTILGVKHNHLLLFLDMGLGKTKIVLDIIMHRKANKQIKKTLILVPNVISINSWGDEVKKHSNLICIELYGTKTERLDKLKNAGDIYILNYGGLQSLLATAKGGKKVVDKDISWFSNMFDLIVWDEIHSSGCKNRKTLTWKISNQLSKKVKYRYGLTGTPFGKNPIDLWAQFFLIDRGEALSSAISLYREAFFTQKYNPFTYNDWVFNPKMEGILNKKILHSSIRYAESEALDLPDKVYIKYKMKFPEENFKYHRIVVERLIEDLKTKNLQKIENTFMALRQISAGFLKVKHEDEEEATIIDFKNNPKLNAIEELLLEIPEDEKIVIFNEFIKSGDMISETLEKININYVRLYSKTKDKELAKDTFLNNPECRVFLANSQSAALALNLQLSRYCIFYESPVSPIVRQQAEKRVHRAGSKKRVFYYDLIIKQSIDAKILKYIKEGEDLFNALIENKVDLRN